MSSSAVRQAQTEGEDTDLPGRAVVDLSLWSDADELDPHLKDIGPLANPRHEKFARARAAGERLERAYALAGYAPDDANAHRLATGNDKVARRIATLRRRWARAADVDTAYLVEQNLEAIRIAREERQPAAITGATREIGTLLGLRVERSERRESSEIEATGDLGALARAIAAALTPRIVDITPDADSSPVDALEADPATTLADDA